MQYHLPLLLDASYQQFLKTYAAVLHSVYASMQSYHVSDARPCLQDLSGDVLVQAVQASPVPVYILCNSRFQHPSMYHADGVREFIGLLDPLVATGKMGGIVYADAIFLTVVARHAPSLCGGLEAVPSVNCGLDTWDKARQQLEVIQDCGFKLPSVMVPDRCLNRDMEGLLRFREAMRQELPGAALHLLANEGCLWQCPYKPAHDALMAYSRCGGEGNPFNQLRDAACLRRFHAEPWRLLASPFIRPEDTPSLEGVADGLKLCGRSRGAVVMQRIAEAYFHQQYDGNLLELLDAQEALAGSLLLPNAALPDDFYARVANCNKDCHGCGWCRELAAATEIRTAAAQLG